MHSKVTISYINSRSYLHQVLLTLTRFIKAVFEHHKTAISRSFLLFCFFEMNCLLIARVRGTWVYTEVMSQTALLCNFEWPGFIKFWSRSKRNLQEKVGKQHVHRNLSQQEKFWSLGHRSMKKFNLIPRFCLLFFPKEEKPKERDCKKKKSVQQQSSVSLSSKPNNEQAWAISFAIN